MVCEVARHVEAGPVRIDQSTRILDDGDSGIKASLYYFPLYYAIDFC